MATKSVWSLTSEAAKYSVVSHFHYLYISRKYFHYLYFSSIFYVLFQSRPSQPAAIVETAVRSAVSEFSYAMRFYRCDSDNTTTYTRKYEK